MCIFCFFFFKQKTAYEMRISDWSSDVCSSDLYVSGNAVFSQYLQIPAVPGAGELAIVCAAIAGAGLGFLWFNTYPAMVFMGDIGALAQIGRASCRERVCQYV